MSARPALLAPPCASAPWIKVCGVRSRADMDACARAGATHVGLNAWPESPRFVPPGELARLAAHAHTLGLTPVVVFVPGSPVSLRALGNSAPIFVQASGSAGIPAALRARLAVSGVGLVEARPSVGGRVEALPWGDVLLLDACSPGRHGGTGRRVPEGLAAQAPHPFVLAGGLGPDNVAAAVTAVRPQGVDAASGLESGPGIKDPARIRDFCAAAREAFSRVRSGK